MLSPMTDLEDTHIGTVAACAILGIDRSTLSRWVAAGRITPALRLPGGPNGVHLFERAEVERIAAARRAAATAFGADRVVGAR
jgi:predicted site-specific integrase-resolvase